MKIFRRGLILLAILTMAGSGAYGWYMHHQASKYAKQLIKEVNTQREVILENQEYKESIEITVASLTSELEAAENSNTILDESNSSISRELSRHRNLVRDLNRQLEETNVSPDLIVTGESDLEGSIQINPEDCEKGDIDVNANVKCALAGVENLDGDWHAKGSSAVKVNRIDTGEVIFEKDGIWNQDNVNVAVVSDAQPDLPEPLKDRSWWTGPGAGLTTDAQLSVGWAVGREFKLPIVKEVMVLGTLEYQAPVSDLTYIPDYETYFDTGASSSAKMMAYILKKF